VGALRNFVEMGRNLTAIRDVAERADERVEQIAAKVERIAELNEKLWSHHLEFCGQVTAEVANAEREVLDELANAEREVLDELNALRQSVIDVRGDDRESRSEGSQL
jgi:hypothetical protein